MALQANGFAGTFLDLNFLDLVFRDIQQLDRGALDRRFVGRSRFLVGPPDGAAEYEQKKAGGQEPLGLHGLSPPPPGNQAESDNREWEHNDTQPERRIQPASGHVERAIFGSLRTYGDQLLARRKPVDNVDHQIPVAERTRACNAVLRGARSPHYHKAALRCTA